MFIDQIVRTISAARNFHTENQLVVSPMSQQLQLFFIVLGTVAVLISGVGWGLKFKRVYLDAWPTDSKLNSVFMRMTASDAKPFYACKFIRDNNIKGKIFNYWTEGGFIAYGQNPDPNTGRTPLQLFMDGRAQAAYEPAAYKMWSDIMSGGPAVYEAKVRKKSLDYKKIGNWVDDKLKAQKVWVVLMPTGQFETPFTKALEYHPDWQIVFYNNKQKLFVDIKTPQGKKIFDGIFNGETLYPDEFSQNLILSQTWFTLVQRADAKKQAMFATKFPELRHEVETEIEGYFKQFEKNIETWPNEHGYHHRIAAALNACSFLKEIARRKGDKSLEQEYARKMTLYQNRRHLLLKRKRW